MLLVDATFVNNGGGRVLLDTLLGLLDASGVVATVLLDQRYSPPRQYPSIVFLTVPPGFFNREIAIFKFRKYARVLFCFNNLPPFFARFKRQIVYFHNVRFLELPQTLGELKRFLGFFFISRWSPVEWVVQTNSVRRALEDYLSCLDFRLSSRNLDIYVFPFFPLYQGPVESEFRRVVRARIGESRSFVYVSDGHYYKNHRVLIRAFLKLVELDKGVSLSLTISEAYPDLAGEIDVLFRNGIRIYNWGKVPNDEMLSFLSEHSICIYPSSSESFGLGLLEAGLCGLPILAAARPYVGEIVSPSLSFNESDVEEVFNSMLSSLQTPVAPTEIVIRDMGIEMVGFLTREDCKTI